MKSLNDHLHAPRKRKSTKGARTKAHIKQVARTIFEREGHAGVTAQGIVEAAGVSSGTFYVYFANKDDILLEICREFMDNMIAALAKSHTGSSAFENICLGQLAYIRPIAENWEFYRALISYGLIEPRLREFSHDMRVREAERTLKVMQGVWHDGELVSQITDPDDALQMAVMLNAMVEGYAQDMLRGMKPGETLDEDEVGNVVRMLARTFFRAAYLEEPPTP
jgi:TetR/AcrR family transcriptional regulator, ethionamide resistance regulator